MKKLLILFILLLQLTLTNACDICGCGVGSNYIGILPEFQKHIVGLRYRYNSLKTHLDINGNSTYLTARETYQLMEIWGGWNIGKHTRIMAVLPYAVNERNNHGNKQSKNGIADISFMGFYELINSRRNVSDDKLLIQSLWMGAGIKLPTGKYIAADKQNTAQNANLFQLGTGSIDININAMYDIRLQDNGLNMAANYKINTANTYDYRYGNKLGMTAQLYHKFRIRNKSTLTPNAGVNYESAQKDVDAGYSVTISGGNILLASLGTELVWKKLAAGVSYQLPVSQQLANGAVKAGNRGMAHIGFTF